MHGGESKKDVWKQQCSFSTSWTCCCGKDDQPPEAYGLERKRELDKTLVDAVCLFDFDAACLVGRHTEQWVAIEITSDHDEPHRIPSQTRVPTLVPDVATDAHLRLSNPHVQSYYTHVLWIHLDGGREGRRNLDDVDDL